jgi:hypothetical protein
LTGFRKEQREINSLAMSSSVPMFLEEQAGSRAMSSTMWSTVRLSSTMERSQRRALSSGIPSTSEARRPTGRPAIWPVRAFSVLVQLRATDSRMGAQMYGGTFVAIISATFLFSLRMS